MSPVSGNGHKAVTQLTLNRVAAECPPYPQNQASLCASGMSALGHKQTFRDVRSMSALPTKADIVHGGSNVRIVA
jgi:hypothetical protein